MATLWLCLAGILYGASCYGAEDLWQVLENRGDALDLMAMEGQRDRILIVGARYEEQQWQNTELPQISEQPRVVLRKQLHIINVSRDEKIAWQRSYPALPDVNEIYSTGSTKNGRLCITYGRHYSDQEFINPVMLQVDPDGKIIWANREAIPGSLMSVPSKNALIQMANLESIRVVGTPDNGCLLAFIVRKQTRQRESLELNLLKVNREGILQWRLNRDTDLYGKLFLVHDEDAGKFRIVQTNQSRDAAIEAMMAARPFSPVNSMLIVSEDGKLEEYLDHKKLPGIEKVWIKHVVDAPGDKVLLAGNSKNAWAGLIDRKGNVTRFFDAADGAFSVVNKSTKEGFIFVRGESVVATDSNLTSPLNLTIDGNVTKQYFNSYLARKLPELGPIQNIVSLDSGAYFILYKLGSRLYKVELKK